MIRKYGIALVFDGATERKAVELSAAHLPQADDPGFMLGSETNVPHLSLLHIMLDDTRVQTCRAALRQALQGKPAPEGVLDGIESRNGYLFWLTEKTDALARLQLGVVSACAHLRSVDCRISWPLGPDRKRMMKRYGYPNVGECFHPHVTLRILRPEFAERRFEPVRWAWQAPHVAFCRADEKGVMTSVIERLALADP